MVKLQFAASGIFWIYEETYWTYLFPVKQTTTPPIEWDCDTLTTTPSSVHDQNDCFHEKISGTLTQKMVLPLNKWGQWMAPDGKMILHPVIMTFGKDDQYVYGSFPYGERIHVVSDLTLNGPNTYGEYQIYGSLSVRYQRYRDGYWIDNGGWDTSPWFVFRVRDSNTVTITNNYDSVPSVYFIHPRPEMRTDLYRYCDETLSFGDLAAKAAKSARRLDCNLIAYVRDFFHMDKLANSLAGWGGEKTIKDALKSISNFYLGNHYGTKLTYADTKKIAKAIESIDYDHATQRIGAEGEIPLKDYGNFRNIKSYRRLNATIRSIDDVQFHAVESIKESTRQLMKEHARFLYEYDMAPTADNLWDLVPYSFVADWFLPFQDSLNQTEVKHYLATLAVIKCFCSTTTEFIQEYDYGDSHTRWTGELKYHWYERSCSKEMPIPELRLDNPDYSATHWVEGAALLIQMW